MTHRLVKCIDPVSWGFMGLTMGRIYEVLKEEDGNIRGGIYYIIPDYNLTSTAAQGFFKDRFVPVEEDTSRMKIEW